LAQDVSLPADLTVLTLAMVPDHDATEQLQKWLKVPRGEDGYFLELHPKLGPVETNTVGIYLCGCSQGPKDVTDSLMQASGAAAKVATLVTNDQLAAEPITAFVDQNVCWGCGTCEELCVFGAAGIVASADLDSDINDKHNINMNARVSVVNTALCKGCGVCASNCPSGAMSIKHFTNTQILKMINAFGEVSG
jgi:heterodisulfide reductase subunit A